MISNQLKGNMKQSPTNSPVSKGNDHLTMSPFSISRPSNFSPPMSPVLSRLSFSGTHKTPPTEMAAQFKEKMQHLGWIGTPSMGKGRQRSSTMAVDSPGSPMTPFSLMSTLDQVSKQLEDKEKDVQLAAEIGKLLLDKNSELEYQVTQLLDYEKKFIDVHSQNEVLKNQNETLSLNLKEATLVNELMVDKLNEANSEVAKLKNQNGTKKSKKGNQVDIDVLQKELQDLSSKDLSREKNIIKLRCDNESLSGKNEKLQNTVNDYEEFLKDYSQVKEKYQYMIVKNQSLIGLAKDIATRKNIVDEYNIIKESFEVSLENIITNTATSRSYDSDEEFKLLQEARETIDILASNGNNNKSIVLQLVSLLKNKDDSSSSFLEDESIRFKIEDEISEEDEKVYHENQLAKQIEISTQNLSRSSILLLIALYISNKHRDLNDQLNKNETSMSELQEDIKELTEKLQINTKLKEKLEIDSVLNQNLIGELQKQTEDLQNEIQSIYVLESKIADLLKEIDTLKDKNTQLSSDNELVIEKLTSDSKQSISVLESRVADLLNKIELLKDRNSQLEHNNESSLEKLSSESKQSIELLENQVKEKQNTIDTQNVTISDLTNQLIQLQSENNNLNSKISQFESQSQTQLSEKDTIISQLNEKINQLQQTISSKSSSNDEASHTIDSLTSQLVSVKEELSQSNSSLEKSVSKEQALSKELQENEKQKATLEANLLSSNNLVSRVQDENTLLKSQLSEKDQFIDQEKTRLLELENIIKSKQDECDSLAKQLECAKVPKECYECNVSLERGRILQSQLNEFENQIDLLKKVHLDEMKCLSEKECLGCLEHNETKKKCDELVSAVHLHKKQVEEMKSHLELLKNASNACDSCVNLQKEIDALRKELDGLKQRMEQENSVLRQEMKKSQSDFIFKESELLKLQLEEQKKVEKEQSLLIVMMEENKQLEARLAQVTSNEVINVHECEEGSLTGRDLEMVKYVNEFLTNKLSIICKYCVATQLRDGFVFCNVVNHFINECIDSRALHKPPCNKSHMSQNVNLIVNSIQSYSSDGKLSNLDINNDQLLFKLLFEIIYIGFLQRVNLIQHPELAILWKHNPEKSDDDKKESWENFIALEPHVYLKRWVNHFMKQLELPLITGFKNIDENVLISLFSQLYPDEQVKDVDSIMLFCKSIGCSIISSCDLIVPNDTTSNSHSILLFLAQLFDKNSGINLSMVKEPLVSDSPEVTSEEKAAKQWLKTVDISAASMDDFRDGLLLLRALDQISPGIVNWKLVNVNPTNLYSMTENCNYCVKLGKDLKFSLVGIAGKDFVDGHKKFLLSFVWQMMRYSVLRKANLKGKNGKDITEADLVAWANSQVSSAGMSTSIKSFNDSTLKDSLFLFDLLESICKGCIDFSNVYIKNLDGESRKSNAKYVISVARRLGSTAIIFWEDIVEVKANMIMLFILDLMSLI